MVKVRKDLTNMIFGRLTVLKQFEDYIDKNKHHYSQWLCECSCESHNKTIVRGTALTKKNPTSSCGCLQKEKISEIRSKENIYDLSGEYAIGYTLKGEEFWIDKEDVELCKQYCWHYNGQGYLWAWDKNKKSKIQIHRLVMGLPSYPEFEVDHKTHPNLSNHKIDNRKENLRIVKQRENDMNRSLASNNTSGVKGVGWDKKRNKWRAYISIKQKQINLGRYNNKEDAIKARKEAEIKYFGEYNYNVYN